MLKTITKKGMKLLSAAAVLTPAFAAGALTLAPADLHAETKTLTITASDFTPTDSKAITAYGDKKYEAEGFVFKGFFKKTASGNFDLPSMKSGFVFPGVGYITVTQIPENATIKSIEICYPSDAGNTDYYVHNVYRYSDQSNLNVTSTGGLTNVNDLTPVVANIIPVPSGSNTATINDKYFLVGIMGTKQANYTISNIIISYETGEGGETPEIVNLTYQENPYEIYVGETLPFPTPSNGNLSDAIYTAGDNSILSIEADGLKALVAGETTVYVSGKIDGKDASGSFAVKVNIKQTEDGELPLLITSNNGATEITPGNTLGMKITTPDGKLAEYKYTFSPAFDGLRYNTIGMSTGIYVPATCPAGQYTLTVTGTGYGANPSKYKGTFDFTVTAIPSKTLTFPNSPYTLSECLKIKV